MMSVVFMNASASILTKVANGLCGRLVFNRLFARIGSVRDTILPHFQCPILPQNERNQLVTSFYKVTETQLLTPYTKYSFTNQKIGRG